VFTKAALMKLLDTGQDWSVKREEFRSAVLQRIAKTFMIYRPNLPKESAGDIALVILLNTKAMTTHLELRDSAPGALFDEFRAMTRLYLQSRLGSLYPKKRASVMTVSALSAIARGNRSSAEHLCEP